MSRLPTYQSLKFDTFAGVNEGDSRNVFPLSISFDPGSSCGMNPDYRPGVGIMIESSFVRDLDAPLGNQMKNGRFLIGGFVMSRTDASRLRDELEVFLKETSQGVT